MMRRLTNAERTSWPHTYLVKTYWPAWNYDRGTCNHSALGRVDWRKAKKLVSKAGAVPNAPDHVHVWVERPGSPKYDNLVCSGCGVVASLHTIHSVRSRKADQRFRHLVSSIASGHVSGDAIEAASKALCAELDWVGMSEARIYRAVLGVASASADVRADVARPLNVERDAALEPTLQAIRKGMRSDFNGYGGRY